MGRAASGVATLAMAGAAGAAATRLTAPRTAIAAATGASRLRWRGDKESCADPRVYSRRIHASYGRRGVAGPKCLASQGETLTPRRAAANHPGGPRHLQPAPSSPTITNT